MLPLPQQLEGQSKRKSASHMERMLFFWKLLRIAHGLGNQLISRFVGWIILIYGTAHSTSTLLTFLPPILRPITEYSTVAECIFQSQQLSKAANMTYNCGCRSSVKVLSHCLEQSREIQASCHTPWRLSRYDGIFWCYW